MVHLAGSEVYLACAASLYAWVFLAHGDLCNVGRDRCRSTTRFALAIRESPDCVACGISTSLSQCLVLWAQNGGTTFALFKRSAKEGKSAAKKVEKKGKQAQQTIRKAAPKPKSIPQKARQPLGPSSV